MGDFNRIAKLKPESGPYGFLQWKGTNACIDIHCECGLHAHLDEEFLYTVKCSQCGKVYDLVPWIQLCPVPPEEVGPHDNIVDLHGC